MGGTPRFLRAYGPVPTEISALAGGDKLRIGTRVRVQVRVRVGVRDRARVRVRVRASAREIRGVLGP